MRACLFVDLFFFSVVCFGVIGNWGGCEAVGSIITTILVCQIDRVCEGTFSKTFLSQQF